MYFLSVFFPAGEKHLYVLFTPAPFVSPSRDGGLAGGRTWARHREPAVGCSFDYQAEIF